MRQDARNRSILFLTKILAHFSRTFDVHSRYWDEVEVNKVLTVDTDRRQHKRLKMLILMRRPKWSEL